MSLLSRFGKKPSPHRLNYAVDPGYLYTLPVDKDGRSDYSITSSTGSSHGSPPSADHTLDIDGVSFASSFQPEDFSSSPPLRTTKPNQIPELRDSAKKYRREQQSQRDSHYKISTAAIDEFEGFTQGSIDSSQELPRGNKPFQPLPTIREPNSYSSDFVSSSPFINTPISPVASCVSPQVAHAILRNLSPEGAHKVVHKLSPQDAKKRRVSQKENIPPHNSPSPYVSRASRSTSGQRKPFTDLHARVQDDSGKSFMGDERPITTTISAKLSRFNNPNTTQRNVPTSSNTHTQNQYDEFDVSRSSKASAKGGDSQHEDGKPSGSNSSKAPKTKKGDGQHHTRKTSISSGDSKNATEDRPTSAAAPTIKSFIIDKFPDTSIVPKPLPVPTGLQGGKVQTQPHPNSRHNIEKADDLAISIDEINILNSLAEAETEKKRLTIVNQTNTRIIKSLEKQVATFRAENESLYSSMSEKIENLAKSFAQTQAENELLRAQLQEVHTSPPDENHSTEITYQNQQHEQYQQHYTQQLQQSSHTRNAPDVHHTQQSGQSQQADNLLHPHIQIAEDDLTQNSQLTRISHTEPLQSYTQDTEPHLARPTLSSAARRVLNSLCPHDQENCGLCASITASKLATYPTVTIPHRIPVSQRTTVAQQHEIDATLRPSQSPRLALEKVIKGIEDEIEHLKLDCAQLQSAYYNLDVSVGRRQRKGMKDGLQQRMEILERKSDQLYDLYDALEGL